MYSEQIGKLRQEYEDQLQKLRSRIEELEQWNANQQGFSHENFFFIFFILFSLEEELRKSIEVQKDVVCSPHFSLEISPQAFRSVGRCGQRSPLSRTRTSE